MRDARKPFINDDGEDERDMFIYAVWYREQGMKADETDLAFLCQAEDEEHAREQCRDAEPGATITRVERLDDY